MSCIVYVPWNPESITYNSVDPTIINTWLIVMRFASRSAEYTMHVAQTMPGMALNPLWARATRKVALERAP